MGQGKRRKAQWNSYRVRALRRHMGLTQAEMAEELGTRQQTISEWEVGMYRPRGASTTLLSIVAERAGFRYEVGNAENASADQAQRNAAASPTGE
ncbi:MAG: helix-turn-helix transcriptional regulator [Chloroflexi bacterium]|nr:helix-turn-helix transcriptional regulator [Chloroflexota bacterium]